MILVSDVIGDAPDVIASGPFAPDSSTYSEALSVLGRRGIVNRIPAAALARFLCKRQFCSLLCRFHANPMIRELSHPYGKKQIIGLNDIGNIL